jgi:hypothetical protein
MKPLFDAASNLVGWVSDDGKNIYNTNMHWSAYVVGENAWNARNDKWIGPVVNGNFHDRSGRPIAWRNSKVSSVMPPMQPMTPMRPMTPMTPMQPMTPMRPMTLMTPMGGWSRSTFDELFG